MRGKLADVMPDWSRGERWLFVSPHDDDIAVAGALLVGAAVRAGVDVSCRIATDGRMGYTALKDREEIVAIRKEETIKSFQTLGVEDVSWYEYPDADLYRHAGRRRADSDEDPDVWEGYTGLQNSLTRELRVLRPDRVFVLSGNDYHPDHKLLNQELLISLFHAQGAIWPELGEQLESVPPLYEIAAYCPFSGDPDYQLQGDQEAFEGKLESIRAYRSQRQIEALLTGIEESGPFEYLRTYPYELYRPDHYASLFRKS
jgi:LmbE family N-acetylglucosaminyl deacetylase